MNLKVKIKKYLYNLHGYDEGEQPILDGQIEETATHLLKLFSDGFMEIVGDDEISKARPDKLRQSPPWQRNQFRTKLRTKITEATK